MGNFRLERLFVMLDEPVPGLNHLTAVDSEEFAWHGSDQHAEQLGVTPLGEFTYAPFERSRWHLPEEGLVTVRSLILLFQKWLAAVENPYGRSAETVTKEIAVLSSVQSVLEAADSMGRQFYLAAKDLA